MSLQRAFTFDKHLSAARLLAYPVHECNPAHLAVAWGKRAALKAVAYSVFTITMVIAIVCVRHAGV